MNVLSNSISTILLIGLLGLVACNSSTSSNKVAATTSTATQASTSTSPKIQAATTNPKKKLSSKGIAIKMNTAAAKSGSETCVDMVVSDFNDVVSMQYSINWDPKILEYKDVRGFQLKDLSKANFGGSKAKDGKLTFSWYDQAIKGISVADNTTIHQICFNAVGQKGAKAKLMITQDPIIVEITGKGGTMLQFSSEPAYVKIK